MAGSHRQNEKLKRARPAAPPKVEPKRTPSAAAVIVPMACGLIALLIDGAWLALSPLLTGPGRDLALLHLAIVGGLLPIALGAATQLSSATTGTAYRYAWIETVGAVLVWAGGLFLAAGFAGVLSSGVALGGALATLGLVIAVPGIVWRVALARPWTPLHAGIGMAMVSFLVVAAIGLGMALRLSRLGGLSLRLAPVHATLGLVFGFVTLLLGVSWQLIGMFAGAPYPKPAASFGSLFAVLAAAAFGLAYFGVSPLAATPFAAAMLLAATLTTHRLLRAAGGLRKRLVATATMVWIWQLALASLILCLPLLWGQSPNVRLALLTGIYGGFVLGVFAFLSRILPFILWLGLRRQAALHVKVPKVDDILPERRLLPGLALLEAGVVASWILGSPGHILLGFGLALLSACALYVIAGHRSALVRADAPGGGFA